MGAPTAEEKDVPYTGKRPLSSDRGRSFIFLSGDGVGDEVLRHLLGGDLIGLHTGGGDETPTPVSYTHLDVYKRQKRYRDNMSKLKNGALEDVAAVVKSLLERDRERSLSTSERKMLVSARQILVSEIVLATGESREQVETKIEESIA